MPKHLPTGYLELADVIAAIPLLLREKRRTRGLSIREVGKEMGISHSTVARIESGNDYVASHAVIVLMWLAE